MSIYFGSITISEHDRVRETYDQRWVLFHSVDIVVFVHKLSDTKYMLYFHDLQLVNDR